MKRTISIKLETTKEQSRMLLETQQAFNAACNRVVPYAVEHRCWNRVTLHHLSYYAVREQSPLGSQMVCNAIRKVCASYKTLSPPKDEPVKIITYKPTSSVHARRFATVASRPKGKPQPPLTLRYDVRTMTLNDDRVSLYTLEGRIKCPLILGDFQADYRKTGKPKEAELIFKNRRWYLNLVLDKKPPEPSGGNEVMGVDVGENTLAATSFGTLYGGEHLRHNRDRFLAHRRRLQSNGTRSAKQLLRKISGRERRHMKHVNHEVSKQIVQEAKTNNVGLIRLEDLTHIRRRIKAGKRVRGRLHRWAFRQLQDFVDYKAKGVGIRVEWVDPAYTSKTCSDCSALGQRVKHQFTCSCGNHAHSDVNAASNIAKLPGSSERGRGIRNVS